GGDEVWAAFAAQEVAEQVRDERRAAALRRLTGSEEAVAEADAAYEAALRRRPRALIVVDAVHLRTYGTRPLGSRYEEISEIARCLRKPMINLRDSGALEDNADVVILLHRDDA